ncbi:MAG: PaaI family thioesterase [Curvibacter sp.]|jgi:uncharacterized protein (TIGR00369 family)|nr:PaaI family thioesterase [Curvibacter sp.]
MSIPFGVLNPFIDHLGFTLERFESGESEVHYEARPEHLNCFAVIHGGATMTLMDVSMAFAARSVQPEIGVVTIEMKTSFMQAARGRLTARGRLIHRTATLAFTEATVFDAAGKPCSHATGTFKYVRRLTEGPEDNQALNVISTN